MKDRIKFSDEMLAAVIAGRKTQTRRLIDKETLRLFDVASEVGECFPLGYNDDEPFERYHIEFSPYGAIGDTINFADKDGDIKGEIEIVDVWLQQVQEISQEDAQAEGFEGYDDDVSGGMSPYSEFSQAWVDIYGKDSWRENPWVWVIEFKQIQG
ncbi:TPA: ASCH domain-containing protein [Morganella morganii]|uniref:ASCH domain-containing protein n=1 Tax=Morganella morganii TaxID=582 RepID=UPI001BDAA235|nr:ASCH domain-containing protein [Morganella morganii]MBT0400984.1 ASCH domain-containing protein [Morganella morganii subsp. morganii]HBZ5600269.1 ASCH domain-containing protein [Morganella morganii]